MPPSGSSEINQFSRNLITLFSIRSGNRPFIIAATMAKSNETQVVISGRVAELRFHITNDVNDDALYTQLNDVRRDLVRNINDLASKTLGDEVEVEEIDFRSGSITILIALTATGVILGGFSKYKNLCDSFTLLTKQLKDLFQNRFAISIPGSRLTSTTTVTGSWTPTGTMALAPSVMGSGSGSDVSLVLVSYLAVSHAALLGLLGWLVVTHLK